MVRKVQPAERPQETRLVVVDGRREEAPGPRRPAPGVTRAANEVATRLAENSRLGNARYPVIVYPGLNVSLLLEEGVSRDGA